MAFKEDFQIASSEAIVASLCARVEATRLARNITRAELAQRSGVSIRTLARLEAGQSVSLNNFVRVLKALDLTDNLAYLLPDPSVRPIERASLRGKERQRARPRRESPPEVWQWGDEEA